jgi:hypothetical protein
MDTGNDLDDRCGLRNKVVAGESVSTPLEVLVQGGTL